MAKEMPDSCPPEPCEFCTGNSSVVKKRFTDGELVRQTSWEWCQENDACAATIDWEKVFGR